MNLAEQQGALRNDLQLAVAPRPPVGMPGLGTERGMARGWGRRPVPVEMLAGVAELEHLGPGLSLSLAGHDWGSAGARTQPIWRDIRDDPIPPSPWQRGCRPGPLPAL